MDAPQLAAAACAFALTLSISAAPALGVEAARAPTPSTVPAVDGVAAHALAHAPSPVTDEPCPLGADDSSTGVVATKKKRNSFARVITAPFRALARLFGGGGKSESGRRETARVKQAPKSVAPTSPAVSVAPAAVTSPAPRVAGTESADAVMQNRAPAVAATTTMPALPASAPTNGQTRQPEPFVAARPHSAGVAPPAVGPFTPLVVGVPRDPVSQGRALIERGNISEAIAELSVAAATGENLVEANNLLGLAHDVRGLHKQAQGFYERALTVAPNDPSVINNLGYSLYLDDRYKEALSKLKTAARLDPSRPQIFTNLGFVYARLNKFDDALRNFARAGGEFYARTQLAVLLEAAGRDRDAIKHYEVARRVRPDSADVLRRLIILYTRTGQRDKAEAAQRVLDRPKNSTASTSS